MPFLGGKWGGKVKQPVLFLEEGAVSDLYCLEQVVMPWP